VAAPVVAAVPDTTSWVALENCTTEEVVPPLRMLGQDVELTSEASVTVVELVPAVTD
jgi:hypothetical protein